MGTSRSVSRCFVSFYSPTSVVALHIAGCEQDEVSSVSPKEAVTLFGGQTSIEAVRYGQVLA